MKLKTITKLGAALTAAFAFSSAAHAVPISGVIAFGGTATLDAGPGSATKVTGWNSGALSGAVAGKADVVGATGDFSATAGTLATFSSPWLLTSGINPLWTVGGYSFELVTSTINTQNATTVSVDGTGWVTGNGKDKTAGTWFFTSQPGNLGGNKFSFSASSDVPDGGTTVALLGFSLLGLHGARRKFAKR